MVNAVSCTAFTRRHAVAIFAVNLNGTIPVNDEKYTRNFALKENLQPSRGVSKVIVSDDTDDTERDTFFDAVPLKVFGNIVTEFRLYSCVINANALTNFHQFCPIPIILLKFFIG